MAMKSKKEKAAYARNWYAAHREEQVIYKRTRRRNNPDEWTTCVMKHTYGITLADYDQILGVQNGVCKICGGVNTNGKRLAIDHDHKTNEIRGLLCFQCNLGIGCFKDDPALLREAKKYLDESTT